MKKIALLRAGSPVHVWVRTFKRWFRADERLLVISTFDGAQELRMDVGETFGEVPDGYLGEFVLELKRR